MAEFSSNRGDLLTPEVPRGMAESLARNELRRATIKPHNPGPSRRAERNSHADQGNSFHLKISGPENRLLDSSY